MKRGIVVLLIAAALGCSAAAASSASARAPSETAAFTLTGTDGMYPHVLAVSATFDSTTAGASRVVFVHIFSSTGTTVATVVQQVAAEQNDWVSCSGQVGPASERGLKVRPRAGITWRQVSGKEQLEFLFSGSAS